MPKKRTHSEFLKELYSKNKYYKEGYFEVIGKYKSKDHKILLKNKYGYLYSLAGNLLQQKSKPSIISATQPEQYLKNMFIELHGRRYDYKLVDYVNSHTKINIICNTHGIFKKSPNKHLCGEGCPKCKAEYIKYRNKINPSGWSLTNWKKASYLSKNYKSFKVYIIEMYDEKESFIKVGRTYGDIAYRSKHFPYSYRSLHMKVDSPENIIKLESELKSTLKYYKYKPFKNFGGMYECFNKQSLKYIREYFLKSKYNQILEKGYMKKLHPDFYLEWEEDKVKWLNLHYNYSIEEDW